jgi:uncharacterized protein (DUF433 family)
MDNRFRVHIDFKPNNPRQVPKIVGSRIRVEDVKIWYEEMGMSSDEIADSYPTITMADIHAALAYYWDNKERLDRFYAEEEAWVEELMRAHPNTLSSDRYRHWRRTMMEITRYPAPHAEIPVAVGEDGS